MSRTPTIDININSNKERMVRVKSMLSKGILDRFNLVESDKELIMDYLENNINRINSLCLRKVGLIAQTLSLNPDYWVQMLEVTLYKR
jgi:hypothetical protein